MTLSEARAELAVWEEARTRLASNQSYTITFPNGHTRTVTRADNPTIITNITLLQRTIEGLDAKARGDRVTHLGVRWT